MEMFIRDLQRDMGGKCSLHSHALQVFSPFSVNVSPFSFVSVCGGAVVLEELLRGAPAQQEIKGHSPA